jgi:AhpD family alkylhydroperoxidase
MHAYAVHTVESAPEKARQSLQGLAQALGFLPNLAATMAGSPPLVNSFVAVFGQLQGGSFTAAERQVLLLTNAVANTCAWAVAFHSTLALKEGVAGDDVQAIRRGQLPRDARLAALSRLTGALIEKRGHVDERELAAFVDAGFGPDQVLEVIAGLAASVMANYAGNITRPPLEEKLQPQSWSAP